MGLKQTGLDLQIKGYQTFKTAVTDMNKLTETLEKRFESLSKRSFSFGGKTLADLIPAGARKRLDDLSKGVLDFVGKTNLMPPALSNAIGGLTDLGGSLGGVVGKLSLTTAAAAALATAFVSLGMRGAAMPGIIEGFDIAAQRAGTLARVLLQDLRTAAKGTVSDMKLMTTANVALAGTKGALAEALGKGGLAGLMEVARVQARTTGQSVDFLFQSLVTGVKRSSPLLIDNTGLVIQIGAANEALAQKLGKSVEALTAEEKGLAVLNATLEAGKAAVEAYGQGSLTAAERIARIQTTITNTLDKLAVSVQPIFNFFLTIGETLVSAVAGPIQAVIIPVIYELSNALFGPLTRAWERVSGIISSVFAPVANLIHRWLIVLVGAVRGFGMAWDWLLRQLTTILGGVGGVLKKYLIEPLANFLDPTEFARRGGAVIGALGEGFLWAANTFVFPAVVEIAEFIADFLMGFSPPKKGPLAAIDKGGAGVAMAWLEGFTGISLKPVSAMMAEVDARLGAIGRLTNEQVKKRLEQLDAELQPFLDGLDIAKAKEVALLEPLKAVQDALEKKMTRALEQFTKGELDADAVRAMDRQAEALQERIGLYESLTEEAEYQLKLKQAEQAYERALLLIQDRRTAGAEDEAKAVEETAEKAPKEPKGTGEPTPAEAGGGALPTLGGDAIGSFLGVSDEDVTGMWKELSGAFKEGLGEGFFTELDKSKEFAGRLTGAFDKAKGSKPFAFLSDTFDSLFGDGPDSLRGKVGGFADSITGKFDELFGSGSALAGIVSSFKDTISGTWDGLFGPGSTLATQVDTFKAGVSDKLTSLFGEGGPVRSALTDFRDAFTTVFEGLFGDGGILTSVDAFETALQTTWDGLFGEGGTIRTLTLDDVKQGFVDAFGVPDGAAYAPFRAFVEAIQDTFDTLLPGVFDRFDLSGISDVFIKAFNPINGVIPLQINALKLKLDTVFGPVGSIVALLGSFSLQGLIDTFSGAVGDIIGWLIGDQEGSLSTVVSSLPGRLVEWVSALPGTLLTALTTPFSDEVASIKRWLTGEDAGSLMYDLINLPVSVTRWLTGLAEALDSALLEPFRTVLDTVRAGIDEIGKGLAEFLDILGSAGDIASGILGGGGSGGGGGGERGFGASGASIRAGEPWIVGEKGWELFRPRVSGELYSHKKSAAMLAALTQPKVITPAPIVIRMPDRSSPPSSVTHHNERSVSATFAAPVSRQDIAMRMSVLKATAGLR